MQVAVNRAAKVLADELRNLQIELESADEIYVERVEVGQQRFQAQPVPGGHAATQPFAASLVAQVVQRDPIIWMRHLDWSHVRRVAADRGDELARGLCVFAPNLEDWNDLSI